MPHILAYVFLISHDSENKTDNQTKYVIYLSFWQNVLLML